MLTWLGAPACRPALLLQQLRTTDARVTLRSYAPADVLLVLMQNGGAANGDGDGGGGTSLLDMCYQAIVLLNGEYEGMHAAKDNPQSFQRRLRVRVSASFCVLARRGVLGVPCLLPAACLYGLYPCNHRTDAR